MIAAASSEYLATGLSDAERPIFEELNARNGRWFDLEIEKLERWTGDRRDGLKGPLDDLDGRIKEAKKAAGRSVARVRQSSTYCANMSMPIDMPSRARFSAETPYNALPQLPPKAKLPRWFVVDTPVGGYNPDWAILKDDGQATLYLVKETKSTMDFTKLRTPEADKVNCGKRHFEAIGVPFSVVVTAQQV